jgi:hypothetical protein
MGVLRQAIEEQRERADAAALGRLALSKREAADLHPSLDCNAATASSDFWRSASRRA